MRRFVVVALLSILTCLPSALEAGSPIRPVTIGYIPAFKGLAGAVAGADFSYYTHVNLAFVNPDEAGDIVSGERMACMAAGPGQTATAADLHRTVSAARAAGSKILISLGGGVIPPCSGDWARLLRPSRRAALVEKILGLVDSHGFDGVDVDIEGELLTRIDRAGDYTPFVVALSAGLRARGKLLTCATASYEGGMVPQSSIPHFDYVGIMSYDAIGPSWGRAGTEHATFAQAERDLQLWLDRGVPRERLVLGLPFYGYGFAGYKANYAFREIRAEFGKRALRSDTIGSLCEGCAYVTYNGLDTLRKKARLARARAGGIMVWEISQDTDDHLLIRTVAKILKARAARPRAAGR